MPDTGLANAGQPTSALAGLSQGIGEVGVVPCALIVAVLFFPQLDAAVRTALPPDGALPSGALRGAVLRFAQLLWLYIGHARYELPNVFADTVGQVFHFFPKGFYAEVEPYTREGRERRNDQTLLRLQRIKTEAEKMRVEEIHPEIFRRLIERIDRWQWRHARLSFVDNLITSEDGRKAKRRFAFLLRTSKEILAKRLAEAEAHWGALDEQADEGASGAPARAGAARAAGAASSRSRTRASKVISKPRAVKMERPTKRRSR